MGLFKPAWKNKDYLKAKKAIMQIGDQETLLKCYFFYADTANPVMRSLQNDAFDRLNLSVLDHGILRQMKEKSHSSQIAKQISKILGEYPSPAELARSISKDSRKEAVDSRQLTQRQLADMVIDFDDSYALAKVTDQSLLKEIMYSLPYANIMLHKGKPKHMLYMTILSVKASEDLLLEFAQDNSKLLASNAVYYMKSQSHLEKAAQHPNISSYERYQAIEKLENRQLAQSLIDSDAELTRLHEHANRTPSDYGFLADHKDY